MPANSAPSDRLVSLDAYRGFTMLAMVSAGFGTGSLRTDPKWGWLADQLEHRLWEGCTFWDLIQPSFMFIVGVAMPFSFAIRAAKGESWGWQFLHAVKRSLLLVLIGVFLDSYYQGVIEVQFIRVLQQIAIGYLIAFLVLHLGPIAQGIAVVVLLVGHTAAYLLYARIVGVDAWTMPTSQAPPYLNNFGVYLDTLLHLPLSRGHYVTFNAVSSAATILMGVLCGQLLRSGASTSRKMAVMIGAGLGGLLAGWLLSGGDGWVPIELPKFLPMIKRLWTASFAIYAAGWTFLMLAAFYFVIDVAGWKAWSFPFVVVGLNSIAMYVAAGLFTSFVRQSLYLVAGLFAGVAPQLVRTVSLGEGRTALAFVPVLHAALVVFVFWLLMFWFYRKRIFFKV